MAYNSKYTKIKKTSQKCNSPKEIETSWNFNTLLTILIIRITLTIIWITGIGIATREIYLASSEHHNLIKRWLTVPGPFINQARDSSDLTWDVTVIDLFYKKQLSWFLVYLVLSQGSRIMWPKVWLPFSCMLTIAFLPTILGARAAIYVLSQPLIYWILMKLKRKSVIWIYTISQFVLQTTEPFFDLLILDEVYEKSQRADYLFICALSWTLSRCISFSMETWNRPFNTNFQALRSLLEYCLYFPLVICGPLVLYNHFEKDVEVVLTEDNRRFKYRKWLKLFLNILRMLIWVILHELASHFLHIRPLGLNAHVLQRLNCWTLAGIVYGISQGYMLTIGVIFGFPSSIAEFDGIDPGGLPSCPGHVHRYSHAWRTFDKGLYALLVRYIYIPMAQTLGQFNLLPGNLKKILASFTTFLFVFIWHGVLTRIFVWSMLQFAVVTLETIGSQIKKRIDVKYGIDPLFWDFFIEPFTSAPLAAMAILVNASFILSPEASLNLIKCLTEKGCWLSVYFFCICFAHFGITVRTWKPFSSNLRSAFNSKYRTTSSHISEKIHSE